VVLVIIAAFVKGDYAFTILYLFLGAYFFGRLWAGYIGKHISLKRVFNPRAFWSEYIPITLEIKNTGWMPIPWLYLRESIPVDIATEKEISQVVSLNPKGRCEIQYELRGRKRGYYIIGPLTTTYGDTLGLSGLLHYDAKPDHIIVYPRIINLTNLHLPSRSPQGTLRHTQPIYEDPTRILSKRDYVAGDSLRRVDWKASAASGKLQVKQHEPSIALEVAIFLNLNSKEFFPQFRFDSAELSIVIAASLANWISSKKQSVGLVTNGTDPLLGGQSVQPIQPRKGRGNLIRVLETLARVQSTESQSIVSLLNEHRPNLSWGTTIIVITNKVDEALFDELFQAKRHGQSIVLVMAGRTTNVQEARKKAQSFGLSFFAIQDESDLDIWRG
jgi:uncharacterized protein (DUF58 family)